MEKAKNGSNFKLFLLCAHSFFFNFSVFHLIFYFNFFFLFSFSLVARLTQGEVSRPGRRFKTGTNGNEDSRPGTKPETKIQDRNQREGSFKTGDKTAKPETKIQDRGQDQE